MAAKKTLAMKLLEGRKVPYMALSYPSELRDAAEVARALDIPAEQVFKTLVVSRTHPGRHILAMVPASSHLDLKKLAEAAGEKKVKMATHQEAEKLTGLQVGGISALALVNKGFEVYLDQSAVAFPQVVISAGEKGQQIRLAPPDLVKVTGARCAEISGPD